jgi:hypothetical protein
MATEPKYLRFDERTQAMWRDYAGRRPQDRGTLSEDFRSVWGVTSADAFTKEPAKLAASVWQRQVLALRAQPGHLTERQLDAFLTELHAVSSNPPCAVTPSFVEIKGLLKEGLTLLCHTDDSFDQALFQDGSAAFEAKLKRLLEGLKARLANEEVAPGAPLTESFYAVLYRVLQLSDACRVSSPAAPGRRRVASAVN